MVDLPGGGPLQPDGLDELGAQNLAVPSMRELPDHHPRPGQAVEWRPGLGLVPQQGELDRHVGGRRVEDGVHPVGVSLQNPAHVFAAGLPVGLAQAPEPEGARGPVRVQGHEPEELAQTTVGRAPVELHLP